MKECNYVWQSSVSCELHRVTAYALTRQAADKEKLSNAYS
jgi:hypothetical protein